MIYSWSYHHDAATRQRLRRLKRDLTALCLWHVFQMGYMGTRSLESGLYHWTMIWRFLPWRAGTVTQTPHDVTNPLWSEFSALITGIAARYATRAAAAPFVKEAMEALESWYLAEEAAEDRELGGGGHRAMLAAHRELRWFGCFRYTVGKPADPPHWPERRDDVVEIHIQNHVTPDSPFGDRRRLAAWMQGLTADVEARVPHVTRIGTGSWLNASRHFLQVYPASLCRVAGPVERRAEGRAGYLGAVHHPRPGAQRAARATPARGADLRLPAGVRQLLGVHDDLFKPPQRPRQPRRQAVGQQVEGGVALPAVPAGDLRASRRPALIGAVARQRASAVGVVGAPVEPCRTPRFGANVLLAGEPRLEPKLHRSRPGGYSPARAFFSLPGRSSRRH